MELRQLRYFVAAAEELHFRRAAERLYVAQSAVSEQIRKLEAELGVRLFDRTNRSVLLTDAGRALLDEGRRLIAQAETAQLAARNAQQRADVRLRIGYLADSLPASVPYALAHLSAAVDVTMETGPALRLIERVREGQLDAVVAGLPTLTSGLSVTSLGYQSVVVALPSTELRSVMPATSLAALAPRRLVLMPRDSNPAFHDAVVALCRDADIAPPIVEAPESRVESALLAVAAGAGTAVLPAAVADRYAFPGVSLVPLEDGDRVFESAVLSRPDADNPATEAFLGAVARLAAVQEHRAVREAGRPALRLAA